MSLVLSYHVDTKGGRATVERIWHIQDWKGHILALAFRQRSSKLMKFSRFARNGLEPEAQSHRKSVSISICRAIKFTTQHDLY